MEEDMGRGHFPSTDVQGQDQVDAVDMRQGRSFVRWVQSCRALVRSTPAFVIQIVDRPNNIELLNAASSPLPNSNGICVHIVSDG